MNAIFEKLTRSWQLFKSSVFVIRTHPKLLVFPIITALFTLMIALFFLAPVVLVLLAPHWVHNTPWQSLAERWGFVRFHGGGAPAQFQPLATLLLAGMYLFDMFLATFSSVAFNSEIMEALAGRGVSIRHGLEAACARWKSILLWSLLAGTVGLFIRALEQRFSFLGRIVAGFIGLAWSVAAIFAVPILVREPSLANPFDVLTKSARTLKASWGEMLAGYLGMQGTNLLFLWGSLLLWGITGAFAIVTHNAWILLIVGVPWLLSLVMYGYLASIASRVYLCALYMYAADGVVPGPYDASMMTMAWKMKKG
ncbi:MAG TPA: DUF6159 family protein [Candidatus Angelobacter sp.]|jgi:hypothetical protein|nr:DUF6159 family protein [Candidatus Angelobacter sp.]